MTDLTNITRDELLQLVASTEELKNKYKYNLLDFVFPTTGKYSRDKYPKIMEFFAAGLTHLLRMLLAPNGYGKSYGLAYELTLHVTGLYPYWWPGLKQENPKHWWLIVPSAQLFKSSLQKVLLGNSILDEDLGTGLIPKDKIVSIKGWPSISGCVQEIQIRHKLGHVVTLEIKTSEQQRKDLQAANLDGVMEDEEPNAEVHGEALARLRPGANKPTGILLLGYTPVDGLTDLTLDWLPQGRPPNGQHPTDKNKYIVYISGAERPVHVTKEWRELFEANTPPHLQEARLNGLPGLGAGKIYPYLESQVFVKQFEIPPHWRRWFSLDFGFHCTCALWFAQDPNTGIIYIYSEYYMEQHQTAQIHALNILARGKYIRGICDPSGGGRQNDGRLLSELFTEYGLDLTPGDNAWMPGIARVCSLFQNGGLKIMDHLEHTKLEYRLYRFDTKKPNEPAPNQKDHAMDNIRYGTSEIFDYVASIPGEADDRYYTNETRDNRRGYDRLTGY